MQINLDIAKISDTYLRDVFRQLISSLNSPMVNQSILEYISNRSVVGEVAIPEAGQAKLPPLKSRPVKDSEKLYKNGSRMLRGVDYNINYSTGVITFTSNLVGTEKIAIDYTR